MDYNNYSHCNDNGDNNRCPSIFWSILLLIFSLFAIVAFIISIITTNLGIEGVQVQLQGNTETIQNNAPIIFDTVITDNSSNISYDTTTGEITITKSGTYYISWWVAANGALIGPTVDLAIVTSTGEIITASNTILSGQLSGNALLDITATNITPVTLRLINTTGSPLSIGPTTVRADLTIINTDF